MEKLIITKGLIALLAIGIFSTAISQAQTSLTNGLITFYPLNGNVNDASGNGNDATAFNGLSYGADLWDSVAYFNGNSQYISLPNTISNYEDLSITFWVKTSESNPNGFPWGLFLLSRDIYNADYDWNISLGQGSKIQFHTGTPANDGIVLVSPNDIGSNVWVHVACVADSAIQLKTIFLNGQAVASTGWVPHPFANNNLPTFIGNASSSANQHPYFIGEMSHVRFYNRALSSNEVAQLYASEPPQPKPHSASGTATSVGGFVVSVVVTNGGFGYTNTPLVHFKDGGGSGAGAYAVVSNGVVTSITVTNAGYGYTNTPQIVIDPPFIFNAVLGIAPMSFLSFSNLTPGGTYQLQRAVAWYWTNQPNSFTATNAFYTQMVAGAGGNYRLALNPVPAQAFATPQMINGFVVGATVNSGGSGYVTSPAVSIVGGGGTNATAASHLSGGVVTSISITSAGIGYTTPPTIQIAQPPAAAVAPKVSPMMELDSASLAPYDNYQIQFLPALGGTWQNWNGGLFSPTDVTNAQYLFVTNGVGFFRVRYVP